MLNKLLIATSNKGKVKEITQLLMGSNVEVVTFLDCNLRTPDETGKTFIENAIIKARYAAQQTGLPALADDSGLVVEALDGRPGLYSSRYANDNATDQDNINKLIIEMENVTMRDAHFICVMVLLRHADDPDPIICQGRWHGEIARIPQGGEGFGYDPIFYLPSLQKTAAELNKVEKSKLSHRGQALRLLQEQLLN